MANGFASIGRFKIRQNELRVELTIRQMQQSIKHLEESWYEDAVGSWDEIDMVNVRS
jgi:hypothetical protein